MRLIDADQFGVISLQGKSDDFIEGVGFMFDKIHEAPTIEERPHGKWVYKKFDEETGISDSYFCSHCNFPLTGVYNSYCAVCGADMRTKESEPKKPWPCDTCGCMIDRTGCQMDLCSDYQKWKEGESNGN